MSTFLVFLAILVYIGGLFYIAYLAERQHNCISRLAQTPVAYALSIAVYCTSWTYYGSVGKAASSGLSFLTIYLGPTITIGLWWILLRRLVLIKNRFRITSIADFISARYGKSQLLAALVTGIALVGNMPYLALQLKAIKSSFTLITGTGGAAGSFITEHFGPFIVVIMTTFTILFGARKLDPTERHRGMVAAVAVESVVKLVAFLACGIYVCYFLAQGIGDIFSPAYTANPTAAAVLKIGEGEHAYITWSTLLLLSMSAIMFLPRQFHVAVIENSSPRHILTAMWMFPLYMIILNIFVVPIALYGINAGIPVEQADTYVLNIPIIHDNSWLALLIFIGGFSAATGMIMIAAMTMATMVVNHLLLPLFDLATFFAPMRRHLLQWHWIGIIAIISGGYWTESEIGESYALVNMGLISFAAALQFAPAGIGAMFWPRGNKAGAISGLSAGFAIWFYTLMLPAFIKSGWINTAILENGPWGISMLRPEHLLGLSTLPSLSHAVFWSMLFNIGLYVGISILCGQNEEEKRIVEEFHATTDSGISSSFGSEDDMVIDMTEKMEALQEVLNQYFPAEKSLAVLSHERDRLSLNQRQSVSILEFAQFHRRIESTLAGSIGNAMAHRALSRDTVFPRQEKELLSRAYADILSRLNLSPQEIAEKVNYYTARDELLTLHSQELEVRILEKEEEIKARIRAEKALTEAEENFRSIFNMPWKASSR